MVSEKKPEIKLVLFFLIVCISKALLLNV
jgi:hypothetical protein